MADLYLHLVFARRLRLAEGLHPLASEALARRPALVALGAALAALPANERRGMSFFRRLFSSAGEVARWQKALSATPGSPRAALAAAAMQKGEGDLGSLARVALGFGLLAYELVEDRVGSLTANLPPAERAGVERAQARLWLQATLPREKDFAHELRPVLSLTEGDSTRRVLAHLDRAMGRAHGSGPGEALLLRWVKSLNAEAAELVEKDALPPSLGVADSDARGPHFESAALVEKVQGAVNAFVLLADRVGDAFAAGEPDDATLSVALAGARAPEWSQAIIDEHQGRWRAWLKAAREAALQRGRNDKPAFGEGEIPPEHRVRSATAVMSLAELPPEADAAGAPPLPEFSGPNVPPLPPTSLPPASVAPTMTQEVSVAQIEAEAASFAAPPHTQEVSVAQIEDQGFASPAHTQEVTAAQVEAVLASPPNVTQPIEAADILREPAPGSNEAGASAGTPQHDNGASGPAGVSAGQVLAPPTGAVDEPVGGAAASSPDAAVPATGRDGATTDPPRE